MLKIEVEGIFPMLTLGVKEALPVLIEGVKGVTIFMLKVEVKGVAFGEKEVILPVAEKVMLGLSTPA